MNPFEYLTSINDTKTDLMVDDVAEKQYNSYMINRSLSYFVDTVLDANEMNIHHHLDSKLQYQYLINKIRKRKRFSKWAKPTDSNDLQIVKDYYGYSNEKARQALAVLAPHELKDIEQRMYKGGKS